MGPRPTAAVRAVVATLGLAMVLAVSSAVNADPRDDVEQAEREVAEAASILENATERAQEAARRYAAANADLPAARARLDEARGHAAAAETAANAAAAAAERAEAELQAANDRYDDSAAAVDRARDDVDELVVSAYKGSGIAALNSFLDARTPVEAVERFGYLDQAASAGQTVVAELADARLRARQAENEALVARQEAEAARAATAEALADAEAAADEAKAAADEAEELNRVRAEALEAAEAEREESLRRYEDAEAEAARVEEELREWEKSQEARSDPPPQGGDSLSLLRMPTHGWKSSNYGMRFDPFYKVWQLHAGVDIAADGGTPIYASAAGTVIRSGWSGGYGLFTCLSHGSYNGQPMSTCYAHQSEILVSGGQTVRRGDVIGRVGTTGASTGDHLHFEVRLNGSPTDPLAYLPNCFC